MVLMPTHCCHTALLCGESALPGRLSLSGRGSDPHAAQCRGPSTGIAEAMDELTSQLLEDIENRLKIRAVRIFIFKYINSLYALPAAHASALPHSLSCTHGARSYTVILPACTRNVRPTHNLSHTDSAETDCTACMADAGLN
jgi:hypothetical protein